MRALLDRFRSAVGGLPATYWTLWAGMLVNRLASFVVAFLGLYLVRERGFSAESAGWVVSLYGAGLLMAGPLGGTLADVLGRRATMVFGLLSGGTCVALLGFVHSPSLLAALAFAAAFTGETYRPAASAMVADLVPPADRVRAFGLIYWAVNLGWAFALSLAGLVAGRTIAGLFLIDASTTFLFAVIVLVRLRETRPAVRHRDSAFSGLARVFRDGQYLGFLALYLVALMVYVQFQLAAPLDWAAHGVGPSGFSFLLALNGLGVVVLQPLLNRRVASADGARMLALSALLIGVGMGLNAFQGSVPAYASGIACLTVGEVVGFPVASALVAALSPADLRGRYQGVFSMSWGVAFSLAPIVGGTALERLGGRTLWLGCLGIGALVAGGHLLIAPARRLRLASQGRRAEFSQSGASPRGARADATNSAP